MTFWPPEPRRFEAEAERKIREQEHQRDSNLLPGDTSISSQGKRLSRRAFVLMQLTVILLIIIGVVIVYHLLH